jgi:lysine-N-methylase
VQIVRERNDPIERRLRKCLALAQLCKQARFDEVKGARLGEFLHMLRISGEAETPADPAQIEAPGLLGRVLFRQALALFTRRDHGPDRGAAQRGRLALLAAAWQFARGRGAVPRLHARMRQTTFEEIEATPNNLTPETEKILERYYAIKLESMQFCGASNFGLPLWEGLEMLCLTLPIILWTARALNDLPREEAICLALNIVDDHFGYNRILKSARQRTSFGILSRTGELIRLIAWYGR